MKVAFQGELGAYSEKAIIKHWGYRVEPIPKPFLKDVFDAVETGETKQGLVPTENSIQGSVIRTLDLLNERKLKIQDEIILRIRHCLIANPRVKIGDIEKVYSHPQALGQSREYLEKHGFEPINTYDTAGSVRMLKEQGILNAAAIASSRAAKFYSMNLLEEGIETNKQNYTRFLVIGHDISDPTGNDKTTIVFNIEKKKGSLVDSLKILSEQGINIIKIETRPVVGKPWEYHYFIDLEGHNKTPVIIKDLRNLEARVSSLKVLGSYPRAN